MLGRLLLCAAVALFTAAAIEHAPAIWRGPPQMLAALDSETRDWVKALENRHGALCCDTADGVPVEVDGWDMAGIVDNTSGMTKAEALDARSGLPCSARGRQMAQCAQFRIDRPEEQ